MTRRPPSPQRGVALLAAMLTVALVTTLAAAALWQQWRLTEVERIARDRAQARWLLTGAMDWARTILREDARSGGTQATDHLAEPWAVPLQEARLSDFVAAAPGSQLEADTAGLADRVFLSGRIVDAQSRLNVNNLVVDGQPDRTSLQAFERLFQLLGLPPQSLAVLVQGLQAAGGSAPTRVLPSTVEQLTWLGLDDTTLTRLTPFVSWLPPMTPVNLNTASAEVLAASVPGLDLAQAQQLVRQRERRVWQSLEDFQRDSGKSVNASTHSISSNHFEVIGQLRMGALQLTERSALYRSGGDVQWRSRQSLPTQTSFVQ